MKLPDELLFLRGRSLPVTLAVEGAECGLACMVMVSRYHGHDVDLNGLRQKFPVSMSGASLRGLMTLADQLGFTTRALKVEMSALGKIKLPAVLHWDLNHFVLLRGVTAKAATIHDPARGKVELSLDEFSKHFTGIVLEISPSASFASVAAKVPVNLSSLWSKLSGLMQGLSQVIALSVALQVVAFALPFQMQLVLDQAVGNNDLNLLTVICLGFGAIAVLQAAVTAMRDWTVQLLGNQMVYQMVGNLLHHLIRLPSSFFEKRHVGDILSRLQSTKAVQDAFTQGVISALIDGAMAVIAGIILFIYAPLLALIVMASLILVLGVTFGFYPVMRARTQESIITSAAEQSHLMETVRAATTIKLMGRENEREGAWRNLYGKTFNASLSLGRYQIWTTFLQSAIIGLQTILVIYLGAHAILTAQGFSVGMLIAFLSFRQTFTDRVISLVTKGFQFRMLGLHLERVGDIIAQDVEIHTNLASPLQFGGGIVAKNLSFRYGATDPWIFQGLDLEINPGEFVAITGASGGGKSTLLKLLLGLQQPEAGQILLDGHPARPELWRSWRAQVGVVAQDDRLMSGTLADNIAFFDPDLDMERVQMAAIAAQVHNDVARMPMNYQTLVGDMGSSLSGGQRQRVLLARALYRQPRALVLDEGTANLDPETEEAIAQLVEQLPITRIVVAHRPALIQRATRVLSVSAGKVVEIRSHSPKAANEGEAEEVKLAAGAETQSTARSRP